MAVHAFATGNEKFSLLVSRLNTKISCVILRLLTDLLSRPV